MGFLTTLLCVLWFLFFFLLGAPPVYCPFEP